MNECLCQDWFSTRGNPCWGHTLIQEGTPFLPANRRVSASYIRVHNPARCYLCCLHAWYQGGLATPPSSTAESSEGVVSHWATAPTHIAPDWQAVSKGHSKRWGLWMDGTCYPSEETNWSHRQEKHLAVCLGGGLLTGGGEQEEGCQPSGYTEGVPSVCLVFMVWLRNITRWFL